MSEKPPVPAALQTLLLICDSDQQREELTHCYYATLGGDPSSPILQLATLISAVAVAGRKNNGNGELAAHLADLKKSEALRTSQAPEIRKYLEQLNSAQGDILNRLRTLPASPAGGDTLVKRLAWRAPNLSHPVAAIFVASAGIATIARRRGWHNQRRRAGRLVVWRPAGTVDLKRSQARSYFAPLSRSAITRS